MLAIAGDVLTSMVDHARACEPQEACGLFSGPAGDDVVDHFFATRNAATSKARFSLDAREMLNVERRVDELGLEIKGVMHSHPTTDAYPSPTDITDASRYDPLGAWRSVIVSLADDAPQIRCFRIVDGRSEEDRIQPF